LIASNLSVPADLLAENNVERSPEQGDRGPAVHAPAGPPFQPRCHKCQSTLFTVVRRISEMRVNRVIADKPYDLAICRQLECKNCASRYRMWFLEFTGQ